jgi:hemolysin activation/secretion protein
MIRNFFKVAAFTLLIVFPLFTLTLSPDNAFGEEHEETKIFIKDFMVIGNKVMKDETILEAIKTYRNNEYSLEELKFIADVVTLLYQEDGYMLAKAYIPVQYIKDGNVKIVVVEGELGSLDLSYSNYYSQGHINGFFSRLIGKAVQESEIESAILRANETPSMTVRTAFKKGKVPGTTDLKVDIEDDYPMFFDFEYNNYGNRQISKNRYTANFSVTDPVAGSTLDLRAIVGDQLDDTFYGGVDLKVPVNYVGTDFGMRYINADYVVGNNFQPLGITGEAEVMGAYFTHSFVHSRNQKLRGSIGFDMKRVFQHALGVQTSNDDLSVGYLRLDFDNLDRYLGKNYVSLTYSHGFDNFLGSLKMDDPNTSRVGADGRFNKFNADIVRIQRLWEKYLLLLRAGGQYSSQRLVASEQLSIGGAYSVRGHELTKYTGDHGYQLSAEFSAPLPFTDKVIIGGKSMSDVIRLAAFIDHGAVFISDPESTEDETEYATGAGAGTRIYLFDRINMKFDVAWPVTSAPVDRRGRFYAQVSAEVIKF